VEDDPEARPLLTGPACNSRAGLGRPRDDAIWTSAGFDHQVHGFEAEVGGGCAFCFPTFTAMGKSAFRHDFSSLWSIGVDDYSAYRRRSTKTIKQHISNTRDFSTFFNPEAITFYKLFNQTQLTFIINSPMYSLTNRLKFLRHKLAWDSDQNDNESQNPKEVYDTGKRPRQKAAARLDFAHQQPTRPLANREHPSGLTKISDHVHDIAPKSNIHRVIMDGYSRRKRPRHRSQTPRSFDEDVIMTDVSPTPGRQGRPNKKKLTLQAISNPVAPQFIPRSEDNYHTAVVAIKTNGEEKREETSAILLRLAKTAKFLSTYDFENMFAENDSLRFTELKPGNEFSKYMEMSDIQSKQETTKNSRKQFQQKRPSQLPLTSQPSAMTIELSLRSEFRALLLTTQHSILRAGMQRHRPKSSNLIRTKSLNWYTTSLSKQTQPSNVATSQSSRKDTRSKNHENSNQIYAEFVKQQTAKRRIAAAIFDAVTAVNRIQQKAARLKNKTIAPHVTTMVIFSQNAPKLSTLMMSKKILDFDFFIDSFQTHSTILSITKQRSWVNPRSEEAKDKIYRIPPPGNGPQLKQQRITEHFTPTMNSRTNSTPERQSTNQVVEMTNKIRILQWNACSLNEEKALQLEILTKESNVDIICISELGPRRQIYGFPTYVQCDRYTESAIFWKRGINATKVDSHLNKKFPKILTQCVEIENELLLIHPYIPPQTKRKTRDQYWTNLLVFTNQWSETNPEHKIFITGDLNTTDKRLGIYHRDEYRYFDQVEASLEIISNKKVATRGTNSLDVALGNTIAKENVSFWKVLDKLSSDHCPTLCELRINETLYRNQNGNMKPKETYSVVDRQETIKKIKKAIEQLNPGSINLTKINLIFCQNVTYKTINHKPIVFWTLELKVAFRAQNKARKAIRRARKKGQDSEGQYQVYKQCVKIFSKMFKKAKKQHIIQQIKTASADPTGAQIYQVIKRLQPKLNKKSKQRKEKTTDAEQESEQIAKNFAKIFGQTDVKPSPEEKVILKRDLRYIKGQLNIEEKPLFTKRELLQALQKANNKSAKGPDGVSSRLIKTVAEIPEIFEAILTAINNNIIKMGKFPKQFKTAKIIPLPKAKPGEYRPISLLPSLSKIVEYMIQIRIREKVENHLPEHQFGCRPGHSAAQALMRLMHYAGSTAGNVNRQQFGAILFDFTKAYDRVPKHILLKKMITLKIPSYLTNIVYSWLKHRKFTVSYRNHTTGTFKQRNGIPQGSSLSVLLWILFVYDIPLKPQQANIYVDDTIGWAVAPSKQEVKDELTNQLKTMIEWCYKNKIKINALKTHVLFNESGPNDEIKFRDVTVKSTDSIRYLGAELCANKASNNSTFVIKTKSISEQIIKRCHVIRRIRKYRITEKIFRQVCQAFIGGIFNFYTPWLAAELGVKETMTPLETAYHEYMRVYTGCFKTTPIPLLYAISNFPLLKDKIVADGALTVIKATSQNNLLGKDYEQWDGSGDGWTPFGQIQNLIEKMHKQIGTMVHTQIMISSDILEKMNKCTFHLDSRKGAMEKHQNGLLIPKEQQVSIWTDGSFNLESEEGSPPISGAAAIVRIMDPGVDNPEIDEYICQVQIHNARSSYECEIIALHIGLDTAIEQKIIGKTIHIFTDSLSCLQQLACLPYRYKYTNSIVIEVAEKLAELVQDNEVELHFIPSHTKEIVESDRIDDLAKGAATDGDDILDHDPFVSSYRLILTKRIRHKQREYVRNNVKDSSFIGYPRRSALRLGKFWIDHPDGAIQYKVDNSYALLNRVRTGHTCARVHLKNIGIEKENICRHCNKHAETVKHQMLKCSAFKKHLKKYRTKYRRLEIQDFYQAIYTHDKFMAGFINAAKRQGCHI